MTVVLLALFGWFVVEVTGGSRAGLAERVTAVAVALWPLLAVLSTRRAHLAVAGAPPVVLDQSVAGIAPPDAGPARGPAPRQPRQLP